MKNADEVELQLPMPPSVNAIYKAFNKRIVPSKAAKAYHESCKNVLRTVYPHVRPLRGPVEIEVTIVTAYPFGHPLRGDIANRDKILHDVLQGVTYDNDSQIVLATTRVKHDNACVPHARIRVSKCSEGEEMNTNAQEISSVADSQEKGG